LLQAIAELEQEIAKPGRHRPARPWGASTSERSEVD
jgi:hypothetical protein